VIGDDELGLSSRGLFNFEGGCYAKTMKLSQDQEPEIYKASTQFSSLLENVKLDVEANEIDFYDSSITENGRASYPLEFVHRRVPTGEGLIPKNIFFLSADAFGVLPPVARLSLQQAVDFFILGYTAKVAGTEIGVKEPKATFSPCFGAPFMLRHPMEYAKLFAEYVEKHQIQIWLINTGWTGGGAGKGQRFPIPVTREIIRAIQNHELESAEFHEDSYFGLKIPVKVRNLDEKILNPVKAWSSEDQYQKVAHSLKDSFHSQLAKFRH
jgi:phosphoenolpyruvate carboxykinase (ATP)